jgi:L-seryl-tRNA(Ser) seleniumtransferase
VIVSRGELIEIGGSFRIPEIIRSAGGRLVEVGTTNRTHRKDYEAAITPETGLLMKTHTSNYRVMGFTRCVTSEDLVEIGHRNRIPVFEDLGSGCLVDLRRFGIDPEPTVGEVVRSGVDLVSFSTDKLLGGPQGGIAVGRSSMIQRLRKNHLLRALRVGKVEQAMVERTLSLYLEPDRVTSVIPFYQALGRSLEYLESQAEKLCSLVRGQLDFEPGVVPLEVSVERSVSCIGGGACPTLEIPGFCLQLRHPRLPAMELAARLRRQRPAILARIQDDTVRLDMRTIFPEDLEPLVEGLSRFVKGLGRIAPGAISGE